MKQVPNISTLLNLFAGCIAIVYVLQSGMVQVTDAMGGQVMVVPESIYMASLFIGIAAVIDFLDGFVARLFNATSEMGKQLDSLADVVSFGVAPAMIIYQFLRLAWAQQEDGLNISSLWLLPAFIVPCAGAYRLARFNIDTEQSSGFKGVPIPAAGLLIASFPLTYWFSNEPWVVQLVVSTWFWYLVITVVSYLMVSTMPMMDLKFKNLSIQNNWPQFSLVVIALVAAVTLKWLAVPLVFVAYVILSLVLPAQGINKTDVRAQP